MIKIQYKTSLATLVLLISAPFANSEAGVEGGDFQEACKTFKGSYEERRAGCDPDCVITQICLFEDGSGRLCDAEGKCGTLKPGKTDDASGSSTVSGSGEYTNHKECVQAERSSCQDRCSEEGGVEAKSCLRSCLDEICVDYSTPTYNGNKKSRKNRSPRRRLGS